MIVTPDDLVFVKESILQDKFPNTKHSIYTKNYADIYGEGSCALTCEFPLNDTLLLRMVVETKANDPGKIRIQFNIPLTAQSCGIVTTISEQDKEEQLKSMSCFAIIELINFLNGIINTQQADLQKMKVVVKKLLGKKTKNAK